MSRSAFVLVEGQTEETFVRQVLAPHFESRGLYLRPVLASTKRTSNGRKFRGGVTSFRKLEMDLLGLLRDTSVVAVTTMVDYYGLPSGFPGSEDLPATLSCYARVERLEAALSRSIGQSRFIPYLSLHEFESLVLVSPEHLEHALPSRERASDLVNRLRSAGKPEEVNDGPQTHPSARIRTLAPTYDKAVHGPLITQRIGLAELRKHCPHFSSWVTKLEALSAS